MRSVNYELNRMQIKLPTPAMQVSVSGNGAPWNAEKSGTRSAVG